MSPQIRRASLGAYAFLVALGLSLHEMWRDELEIWLIARDSGSLGELWTHMTTEGHPVLWYVLCWLASFVSSHPVAMQALHWAIAVGGAWLVLKHAPCSVTERVLYVFGYFSLYEYAVISRGYGLQMLLAFVACVLWTRRAERPLLLGVVLALLANTTLYGAVFAGGFGLAIVVEYVTDPARRPKTWGAAIAGLAINGAGILASAATVGWQATQMGEAHTGVYQPAFDLRWLFDTFATVARGFLPFPDLFETHVWNSVFFDWIPAGAWVAGALGLALIVVACGALKRHTALFLGFAAAAVAILGVIGVYWYGSLRHHGQIFLLCVVFAWLARLESRDDDGEPRFAERMFRRGAVPVLAVQALAGLAMLAIDVVRPFSHAVTAGQALSQPELAGLPVAGSRDYAVQPIAAYLDGPIYYPESDTWGTFLDWGPIRQHVGVEKVLDDAMRLAREDERGLALVLNYALGEIEVGESMDFATDLRATHVARFEGAIVEDENFYLYRIDRIDPGGEGAP